MDEHLIPEDVEPEKPKEMISGPVSFHSLAEETGCDVQLIKDAVRVVGNDEGRVRAWLSGYLSPDKRRKNK
jgi:hypothetical protein